MERDQGVLHVGELNYGLGLIVEGFAADVILDLSNFEQKGLTNSKECITMFTSQTKGGKH